MNTYLYLYLYTCIHTIYYTFTHTSGVCISESEGERREEAPREARLPVPPWVLFPKLELPEYIYIYIHISISIHTYTYLRNLRLGIGGREARGGTPGGPAARAPLGIVPQAGVARGRHR